MRPSSALCRSRRWVATTAAALAHAPIAGAQSAPPLPRISAQEAAAQPKKTAGTLVIDFTSDERDCSRRVGSDPLLDVLGARYAGKLRFVRVAWSPWNPFPPEVKRRRLTGVPACVGIRNGTVVWTVYGCAGPAGVEQIDRHAQALLAGAARP